MKQIQFTGKRNKDQINNISSQKVAIRSSVNYEEPSHEVQVSLINKYFMGHTDKMEKDVKREITRKITGYKGQDIKKDIYDESLLVNVCDVLEKLVASKLKCHYCRNNVKVLFSGVRDSQQWTLDRIDNDLCHSRENTVVCCLKCNLERRVLDAEKFTFTKQLKIKKMEYNEL
jgi:hypothetical protein